MKPQGFCIGTVLKTPELVSTDGKKPFLSFTIECSNTRTSYTDRVKCSLYDNDLPGVQSQITQGAQLAVNGEFGAEGYLSTKTNKAVGSLKMFVKAWEVLGEPQRSQSSPPPTARAPAPQPAAPVTSPDQDDVPF